MIGRFRTATDDGKTSQRSLELLDLQHHLPYRAEKLSHQRNLHTPSVSDESVAGDYLEIM